MASGNSIMRTYLRPGHFSVSQVTTEYVFQSSKVWADYLLSKRQPQNRRRREETSLPYPRYLEEKRCMKK